MKIQISLLLYYYFVVWTTTTKFILIMTFCWFIASRSSSASWIKSSTSTSTSLSVYASQASSTTVRFKQRQQEQQQQRQLQLHFHNFYRSLSKYSSSTSSSSSSSSSSRNYSYISRQQGIERPLAFVMGGNGNVREIKASNQKISPFVTDGTTSSITGMSNIYQNKFVLLRDGWRKNSFETFYSPSFATTTRTRTATRRYLSSSSSSSTDNENDDDIDDTLSFFSNETFESMGIKSSTLLRRLQNNFFTDSDNNDENDDTNTIRPTQIQAKTYDLIRNEMSDIIIGAETGSGKTLAYLLPILDDILSYKEQQGQGQGQDQETSHHHPPNDFARALILVPNKELVQQVLRMAVPLCCNSGQASDCVIYGGNSRPAMGSSSASSSSTTTTTAAATAASATDNNNPIVRLAIMPGGLNEPTDFKPFREATSGTAPPVDIVISTPAAVGPLGLKPKHIHMFADISTLVIDEADMLLDGGYIRQLENVLIGFRRADKLNPSMLMGRHDDDDIHDDELAEAVGKKKFKTQYVFCAATLPNSGTKSVDAYIQRRFPYAKRVHTSRMHNAKHYGLVHNGIQWYNVETKKERMSQLIKLLKTPSTSTTSVSTSDEQEHGLNGLGGEKIMIFLNSVDDVEGAHGALEREGIVSVPFHAKIPLKERTENLQRFRNYNAATSTVVDDDDDGNENQNDKNDDDTVPILVCTDLASRGLDIPGITIVVQLQFSNNVVSHLHRMGRCGRAGKQIGRGIIFYSSTNERHLVDVVREAEQQQESMVLHGDVDEKYHNNDNDDDDDNNVDDDTNDGTAGIKKTLNIGKVHDAFSRKRGFSKKRKKQRRLEEGRKQEQGRFDGETTQNY